MLPLMNGMRRRVPGRLVAVVLLAGCYASSSEEGGEDAEARDVRDADAVHDAVADEVAPDVPPGCRAQQAWEDPDIDCDMCNPCDATPYIWLGDRCAYQPLCCRCAGPDCGNLFPTLEDCVDAYDACPMAAGEGADFPDARLVWQSPGGFAGMGPVLAIDGQGGVRYWEFDAGLPGLDDPTWSRTDYDYGEYLGEEAANDFFARMRDVNYAALPHPPGPWAECYPTLIFRTCSGCEDVRLDYNNAEDLLPEMRAVYDWLDGRLCRGLASARLPSNYCVFDL